MSSEDIMLKEKLYCPVCALPMLGNEETRTAPTGERAHKECADEVINRVK